MGGVRRVLQGEQDEGSVQQEKRKKKIQQQLQLIGTSGSRCTCARCQPVESKVWKVTKQQKRGG